MTKIRRDRPSSNTPALPCTEKTPGRGSARLVFIILAGLLLVGLSWWLRFSPWAHENALRVRDLSQLEESVRINPTDFAGRYYLAKTYYLAQRFPEAQAEYSEAVRLEPASARAHLGLGLTLMERGESDLARSELENALRYDPSLAWAEHMIGKIDWQHGDVNSALSHELRATKLDPRSHPAWYFLGVCYIQLHRYDQGVDALRQALKRQEANARYNTALAELLVYRGQTDEGRKHYERALQIDPNFGPACALMGGFYLRKVAGPEAIERAQTLLERATQLKTYHPNQVYFDLGELYLQKGMYQRAVDVLKSSVKLDPRDERPYYSLAKAYRRLGDDRSARAADEKFRTISSNHVQLQTLEARVFHDPENASARLLLARLYRNLGLDSQARSQYSTYLKLEPGDTKIADEFQKWLAAPSLRSVKHTERPDIDLPPVH